MKNQISVICLQVSGSQNDEARCAGSSPWVWRAAGDGDRARCPVTDVFLRSAFRRFIFGRFEPG